MKEEYSYPLDEEGRNIVRVIKTYDKGLVDVTVIYYTIKEGKAIPLVTFDLAHGFAHRDLRYLDTKDKRRKKKLEVKNLEEFLDIALEDISRNWRKYLEEFESKEIRR